MDATKTTVSLAEFQENSSFYLQQAQTQPITILGQQDFTLMTKEMYQELQARAHPLPSELAMPEPSDATDRDTDALIKERAQLHQTTLKKLAQR